MEHLREHPSPDLEAAHSTPNLTPHLEIELKVKVKSKAESRKIRKRLEKADFILDKETLIVDFVEPSRSVTSRVRLEKTSGDTTVTCYLGKKSHPIEGELEEYVRQEQDPSVPAEFAIDLLMRAIEANYSEPIPYYTKKRRYYKGELQGYSTSAALDKPNGLLRKYSQRYLEIEIQIPLESAEPEIAKVVAIIREFISTLVGEDRKTEISYRRMVIDTWKSRRMIRKK